MCWGLLFGLPKKQKPKGTSSGEKKRRERVPSGSLHGDGRPVVARYQEKRTSKDSTRSKRSGHSVRSKSPQYEDVRHVRHTVPHSDLRRTRDEYRPPPLNVHVPDRWHRAVDIASENSSQEMLLNPRPHRSPRERQRHSRRTSQTPLRGHGAKRDPPRNSKSKSNLRQESGWSLLFSPPPPKQSTRSRQYQPLDSSPPNRRHHQSATISPSQPRHRPSRQPPTTQHLPSTRSARSQTPNTAIHRTPDRRFAVLAATNQALEDLRREAFAHPSPPPRRDRLRRYQGVAVPASSIPFNWDCVSSSQTSTAHSEPRRRRRR
ncbi:hypothetical protein M011DRAFT_496762 [Sporormia fimetaria CBS 119925]|uniref:Uncharacterized protein n=1 Tax=Sporormia fimetaria CBS 119925 TaxID=1340428 RepID=A0A6A6UZC2_9PLEO|nr:hypothetical protein M011DRAFT_496762 [Sporormia fimetaria CBS 119925]